jgi:hypothetical protein
MSKNRPRQKTVDARKATEEQKKQQRDDADWSFEDMLREKSRRTGYRR